MFAWFRRLLNKKSKPLVIKSDESDPRKWKKPIYVAEPTPEKPKEDTFVEDVLLGYAGVAIIESLETPTPTVTDGGGGAASWDDAPCSSDSGGSDSSYDSGDSGCGSPDSGGSNDTGF